MSTETMNGRERIMAALNGRDVDRIPWSPCIDGYFLGDVEQVEGFRRIGADIMARHVLNFYGSAPFRVSAPVPGKNMPWEKRERSVGDETEIVYETPVGTLTERIKLNSASPNIPWTTRRRVQSVEDAKVLTWMCEQAEYVPISDFFNEIDARIGDDGITTTSILGTPIMWLLNSEVDIDRFWYLYFDHTSVMEELFEAAHEMLKRMCTASAEGPGEVVIQYDNLSSSLCSPKIWAKYTPRWIDEYADILHAGNKLYLMHACGHLFEFGEMIKELPLDGLVDVATPPTGTLPDLATARKLWGPDKLVMGGIDSTAQAQLDQMGMKDHVGDILTKMGDGRRMILGTNDAVPKDATWENLQAVTEVVGEKGVFPLEKIRPLFGSST
ncbi:MAG: hypothetical protein GY866_39900 [Proteobacteria bacterium]|nr:hypothetical protein [Pseudomonadota bacterium]